jgi:uncharacterized protein (TIGR03067 family)
MKIHARWLLTSVLYFAADGHGQTQDADDREKLAGVWECASAVNDGKPLAEETVHKLRLTLTRNRGYKTELGPQVLFDSTYALDTQKQPKYIDLIGAEGENKGKAGLGIYSLEEDSLTICYTMPGHDRPKEFESKAGSGATLVVWKRVKP